ncbi:MAG: DUF5777 family beta-barrel protein [Bacteroidota bacterium]
MIPTPKFSLILNLAFISLFSSHVYAQDDMMALLEAASDPITQYTTATFKGTRLINGHSMETRRQGTLEFLISHRFGRLNSGAYEFFGLDAANIRLGLEYAFFDFLTVGIGRNSFEKTYDGFIKARLLKQSTGAKNIPVSVTGFTSIAINSLRTDDPQVFPNFSDRLFYTTQLLIARKFGDALSLQLMPTLVHSNRIEEIRGDNDKYALGFGGRVKLTKRLSINAEYYYRLNEPEEDEFYNSLALGFDIETGGHVFQLHLTNSRAMIEKGFVSETTGDFFSGDIHFGFNISRSF